MECSRLPPRHSRDLIRVSDWEPASPKGPLVSTNLDCQRILWTTKPSSSLTLWWQPPPPPAPPLVIDRRLARRRRRRRRPYVPNSPPSIPSSVAFFFFSTSPSSTPSLLALFLSPTLSFHHIHLVTFPSSPRLPSCLSLASFSPPLFSVALLSSFVFRRAPPSSLFLFPARLPFPFLGSTLCLDFQSIATSASISRLWSLLASQSLDFWTRERTT